MDHGRFRSSQDFEHVELMLVKWLQLGIKWLHNIYHKITQNHIEAKA